MKFSGPSLATPTETRTILAEGLEIIGEVKFTDAMRVETKISGKVFSDSGSLVVGEKGRLEATIEAGYVEILGTVEGFIKAKYKVLIRAGSRVTGDITTPDLVIEHGAFFEGKCHVGLPS
jgi:cytoskeletal protein CcmA (bactofilin family)